MKAVSAAMLSNHIFSNSRDVYLPKNHYEPSSPEMVPTNPTGSWTRPYMENIARMSALLESHPDHQFIIIGDVNCRFGKLRQSFISDKPVAKSWHYNAMDADGIPNHNGRRLAAALAPLTVLNGLSTDTEQFISRATYTVLEESGSLNWISVFCHLVSSML